MFFLDLIMYLVPMEIRRDRIPLNWSDIKWQDSLWVLWSEPRSCMREVCYYCPLDHLSSFHVVYIISLNCGVFQLVFSQYFQCASSLTFSIQRFSSIKSVGSLYYGSLYDKRSFFFSVSNILSLVIIWYIDKILVSLIFETKSHNVAKA